MGRPFGATESGRIIMGAIGVAKIGDMTESDYNEEGFELNPTILEQSECTRLIIMKV